MNIQPIKGFFKKPYYPLNLITISKENLLHNYHYLSALHQGVAVSPVLKSNAYGHGIRNIGKLLDPFHPAFFSVDSLFEGYALLEVKVKSPILIMGYVDPRNLMHKKLPFSYGLYDLHFAKALNDAKTKAKIHIFVDTGMHREGIKLENLREVVREIKKMEYITIEGLMSHFGAVDNLDPKLHAFTKKQIENFKEAQQILQEEGVIPQWIHMAGSGGTLRYIELGGQLGNVVRVGKSLYGMDPRGENKNLKAVLELSSTLAQIKHLRKGESVGYDFTFTADRDLTIGILPIGYNDGVDRRLSNVGVVWIDEVYCPIIGRVSMNITTIDISKVKNPQVGQKVVVFSSNLSDKNSVVSAAELCNTIARELLVHLAASTRRVIV